MLSFCCPGLETPQLLLLPYILKLFLLLWQTFNCKKYPFANGKEFCHLIKIFLFELSLAMFIQMAKINPDQIRKFSHIFKFFCYLNICHNRRNSFCSSSWLRKIHILIQSSCKLEGTPKFVLSRPPLCIGSLQPLDLVYSAFLHSSLISLFIVWLYQIFIQIILFP